MPAAFAFATTYFLLDTFVEGGLLFDGVDSEKPVERFSDFVYYSFVTQLTIGFGDVTPQHWLSKLLTVVQGTLGVVFVGALVAVLVDELKAIRNVVFIKALRFYTPEMMYGLSAPLVLKLWFSRDISAVVTDLHFQLRALDADEELLKIDLNPSRKDYLVEQSTELKLEKVGVDEDGKLTGLKSTPPTPEGRFGGLSNAEIVKLALHYDYVVEGRRYFQFCPVRDLNAIASILKSELPAETPTQTFPCAEAGLAP